ncbi:hypothetical protein Taro_007556 [Colocasia esculenta]|uniref:Uncharacterized protein n=1 Tax=Colocasia esculenta TaxID=4460 RepID=A0A843U4C4_COLES|nr:hypothetical protein [Colocasia esculenta]
MVICGIAPGLGFAPVKATTLGVAFLTRQPDASSSGLEGDTLKGRDRMATKGSVATRIACKSQGDWNKLFLTYIP